MKLVANSTRSLSDAITAITQAFQEKRYVRITLTTGRDRTLDQNAMFFSLYVRISEVLGDGSAEDIGYWRAYCKLRFGVALLQIHDESFRARWHRLVLTNPLLQNWEAQIDLMRDTMFGQDGFPVTRLFDTKLGGQYIDATVRHFSTMGIYFEDLLDGTKKLEERRAEKQAQKERRALSASARASVARKAAQAAKIAHVRAGMIGLTLEWTDKNPLGDDGESELTATNKNPLQFGCAQKMWDNHQFRAWIAEGFFTWEAEVILVFKLLKPRPDKTHREDIIHVRHTGRLRDPEKGEDTPINNEIEKQIMAELMANSARADGDKNKGVLQFAKYKLVCVGI